MSPVSEDFYVLKNSGGGHEHFELRGRLVFGRLHHRHEECDHQPSHGEDRDQPAIFCDVEQELKRVESAVRLLVVAAIAVAVHGAVVVEVGLERLCVRRLHLEWPALVKHASPG
jgi:hypothetical protein